MAVYSNESVKSSHLNIISPSLTRISISSFLHPARPGSGVRQLRLVPGSSPAGGGHFQPGILRTSHWSSSHNPALSLVQSLSVS